jgi:fructoselysine 6-kinase
MRIAAVGECAIDRYLDVGVERVGGISLNFAIHARSAGAESVALVSCTGTDAGGEAVRARLVAAGVDTSRLHRLPGETASQQIRLGAGGERSFPPGGYRGGVLADFRLSEDDLGAISAADVVAVPCFREIAHLTEAVVHDGARRGVLVGDLLDGTELGRSFAGVEPLLGAFDLLFLSADPAAVERLAPRLERSGTMLVITHGAAGSTALLNGHCFTEPAVAVPVEERLDTTGCGDAFQAAFTVSYLRRRDPQAALRAGAERAARVIRHLGGTGDEAAS